MSAVDALILAGHRGSGDPVAALGGVTHKALAPIAGRPMLAHVLDAVSAVAEVARIYICIDAGAELSSAAQGIAFIRLEPAASPAASVVAALAATGGARPLLVTTADHPLLTPVMIRFFLDHAPSDADLVVGLAEAPLVSAAFPGARRTSFRLGGTRYGGCNLYLARQPGAGRVAAYWQRLERHRKHPLRLARAIGLQALMLYALGLLPLDAALARVSRLTQARIRPVLLPFAEAAIDVDTADDMRLAAEILARRAAA